MGIEWFRDLSITLMGFMCTAVLIFVAILGYFLYRKIKATLSLVQTLVKSVNDTINKVEKTIDTTSRNINDTITEVKESIKTVSKGIDDTVTSMQESMKPLLPMLAVIQGISEGIKNIRQIFKKE